MILSKRRCSDRLELSTGECRLEDIGCIDGAAFGRTGAHNVVEFVNEQDHRVTRRLHLGEELLHPVLKFATILGPGHQTRNVQGDDALVLEKFRHVARRYLPREALNNSRLAHTGIANEDWVVLRPPQQDLQETLCLLLSSNDGVQFPLACHLGQIAAVLVERGSLRSLPRLMARTCRLGRMLGPSK